MRGEGGESGERGEGGEGGEEGEGGEGGEGNLSLQSVKWLILIILGLIFRGYVSLASQSPYPNVVDSYYRPHLSHLGKYVIFAIPT